MLELYNYKDLNKKNNIGTLMASLISSIPLGLSSLILLLITIKTKSSASSVENPAVAFFIFGDSIVDVGTNNYIDTVAKFKADYSPYGRNHFSGAPTGRFSDGRVMVDFIAEYAKLPTIPPPFLQPSASFSSGANFASGGAGGLPDTNQGLVISLQKQIKQFEELKEALYKDHGETEAHRLISQAVYLVSVGSTDYIRYVYNSGVHEAYLSEDYIGMVTGNLSQAIQELYEKGARKFCVLDLMPLGCMPVSRALLDANRTSGSCFEEFSALAKEHNKALSASLIIMEYIFQGFKYAHSNLYEWMEKRFDHPTEYGFKDAVNACCGTGAYRGIPSCGGRKEVKEYEVCGAPEEHVWWDSLHVSERIHEQIAMQLWTSSSSSTSSFSLKDFFDVDVSSRVEDVVVDEQYNVGSSL